MNLISDRVHSSIPAGDHSVELLSEALPKYRRQGQCCGHNARCLKLLEEHLQVDSKRKALLGNGKSTLESDASSSCPRKKKVSDRLHKLANNLLAINFALSGPKFYLLICHVVSIPPAQLHKAALP